MTATLSKMMPLGFVAPEFNLPDTGGKIISTSDFEKSKALLVVFMCNHCPFVRHILNGLVKLAAEYLEKGIAIVGINSNDIENYPDDSPEMMAEMVQEAKIPFPYLFDEDQTVAKAYGATCTPDFFLFDKDRRLFYRGQFDDSRPGNDLPVTGKDLRDAIDVVLTGKPVPPVQKPSMGCSIKWK